MGVGGEKKNVMCLHAEMKKLMKGFKPESDCGNMLLMISGWQDFVVWLI